MQIRFVLGRRPLKVLVAIGYGVMVSSVFAVPPNYNRSVVAPSQADTVAGTFDSVDVELLGNVPVEDFPSNSTRANDVWGYTSPRGHKYGILGLTHGTGFVDITDPRNPVIVADIPDAISTWSDMKVYGEFAYNVNETSGGMQIIDLRRIDDGIVNLLGVATGGLTTAHNVAVNTESGFAYPCGTNQVSGFIAYDLTIPFNPLPVGSWGGVFVHDLQAVSYDDCPIPARSGEPCEIVFAFTGGSGLKIIDVTDKSGMPTLSTMTYPTIKYCHQGWISEDRRYVFFNDEQDELFGTVTNTTTYVADIQDILSPTLVATFEHSGNWIDHNLIVRGDRIYQAHYAAGLRVLDATDPLNLSEVAYFDTRPEDDQTGFPGAWGVYVGFPSRVILLSDRDRGLFVLCDEPDRPVPGFTVDANPALCDVAVSFDASGSTTCDSALSLVSYEWDFDYDGVTFTIDDTGVTPSHVYLDEGSYTIALRVTDDLSTQEISEFTIDVECPPPIPTVSEWGLMAMSLVLMGLAAKIITKRPMSL